MKDVAGTVENKHSIIKENKKEKSKKKVIFFKEKDYLFFTLCIWAKKFKICFYLLFFKKRIIFIPKSLHK